MTLAIIPDVDDKPRLPDVVLLEAADAAGVTESVIERALNLALDGGPDELVEGWIDDRACVDVDPNDFYPGRGVNQRPLLARCTSCPVQAECLSAALVGGEKFGVWGGTSERRRRALRKVLRANGLMGVVGEDAYLPWREDGADHEPPPESHLRLVVDPWPHQLRAIECIVDAIGAGGVCQVAMATATGKTLVGVWASDALAADKVLVLVPSLALVSQTAEVWRREPRWIDAPMLAVCSDAGEAELELTATTDPADVQEFLAGPGPAVIVATYQSSAVLATAGCTFDLIIADEAHHLAGPVDKAFSIVLRREIPATRILYMTATPKRFQRSRRADGMQAVSMDEAGGFGPRVFDFTLDQAVASGVIADYRVVVAAVDREVFDRVARQLDEDIDPHLLAGAIAVVRSMGEYRLGSCLSFHNRVDRARRFAELVGAVAEVLPADRPPEPGWAGFVHGNASVRIRRRLLGRLADRHSWGVLANAKALGEGVDVPSLDAVAIVDPKQSDTDVLQACGRALRRPTGTKIGTVLLPVLLTAHADPDDPLSGADPKSIELVSGVLRALRAHDADLGRRLDVARRNIARTRGSHDTSIGHRLRRIAARRLLRTRVELHVPGGATGELAGAIALHVVRDATSSWEEAYGRLLAWMDDNDGRLPGQTVKVPDETGTFSLGAWVSAQRTDYSRGLLASDRAERLNATPGWQWNRREAMWWEKFDVLKDYVERYGYPRGESQSNYRKEYKGVRVFQFLASCRASKSSHENNWIEQFPDRIAALEALPGWVWNTKDAEWEESFARLERWVTLAGHAAPSDGDRVDDQNMGRWCTKQRSRIKAGRLDEKRIARLRALPGWVDDYWTVNDALWDLRFDMLERFVAHHGRLPFQKEKVEGFYLGAWLAKFRHQRDGSRSTITPERIARLESIPGWTWDADEDAWNTTRDLLASIAPSRLGSDGIVVIPQVRVNDVDLSSWATLQRMYYRRGTLRADRTASLEAINGWSWNPGNGRRPLTSTEVNACQT